MKNSSVVFKCLIVILLGFIAACGVKQDQAAENQGVAAPDQVKAAQEERTIKHKMGETKVPADPKNIGALQPFIMASASEGICDGRIQNIPGDFDGKAAGD